MPGRSGLPLRSYFSDSIQAGPPVTCLACSPYAKTMRSATVVLVVVKRLLPPRPTRIELPGASGRLGLMVATSKVGLASAGIRRGGGGGSGISHAVVGVARARFSGVVGPPWLHVPA